MTSPRDPFFDWPRRFVHWLCGGREDFREFQRRKARRRHQAARILCLWVWLAAAAAILACPGANCMIPLLLGATFLSFAILDQA